MTGAAVGRDGSLADGGPDGAATVGAGALWFGLFGAPLFWSAQLIATYALAAHRCVSRPTPVIVTTLPGIRATACVIIVLALAGCATATMVAARNVRATAPSGARVEAPSLGARRGRMRFMANSGVLLGALFTAAVIPSGLALLLLPVCW